MSCTAESVLSGSKSLERRKEMDYQAASSASIAFITAVQDSLDRPRYHQQLIVLDP